MQRQQQARDLGFDEVIDLSRGEAQRRRFAASQKGLWCRTIVDRRKSAEKILSEALSTLATGGSLNDLGLLRRAQEQPSTSRI